MTETHNEGVQDVGNNEDLWRGFLAGDNQREKRFRAVLKLIPSDPRCTMCAAPFSGPGAPLMRAIGKQRSDRNPKWCNSCFTFMATHRGGAEVTGTLLFADIRGSTALAERMSPTEFRTLLDRFYDAASGAVFDHDGMVDKFVGDELVAMFFPGLTRENHAAAAIDAARSLLRMTDHEVSSGPTVPVGAGIHSGSMWIGTVGTAGRVELTVVGDAVNTTSRLASAAGAGEILVSTTAAEIAGLDSQLPHEPLTLKGKTEPTEVVRLNVSP